MSSFVYAFFISPRASSLNLMSFLACATMAMASALTAASSSGSPVRVTLATRGGGCGRLPARYRRAGRCLPERVARRRASRHAWRTAYVRQSCISKDSRRCKARLGAWLLPWRPWCDACAVAFLAGAWQSRVDRGQRAVLQRC